jgi:hypothetical protein
MWREIHAAHVGIAMEEHHFEEAVLYLEDRVELKNWLASEIEAVAERYRRHTGAAVNRVEIVIVDERGDTKQLNYRLPRIVAD